VYNHIHSIVLYLLCDDFAFTLNLSRVLQRCFAMYHTCHVLCKLCRPIPHFVMCIVSCIVLYHSFHAYCSVVSYCITLVTRNVTLCLPVSQFKRDLLRCFFLQRSCHIYWCVAFFPYNICHTWSKSLFSRVLLHSHTVL
jgi:hypothetical protein